jgi:hypothetical protein
MLNFTSAETKITQNYTKVILLSTFHTKRLLSGASSGLRIFYILNRKFQNTTPMFIYIYLSLQNQALGHDTSLSCQFWKICIKIGLDRATLTVTWVSGRSIKMANTSCLSVKICIAVPRTRVEIHALRLRILLKVVSTLHSSVPCPFPTTQMDIRKS